MKLEFWEQKKFHKLNFLKKRDLIWGEAIPHMRVSLIWGVPETPSIVDGVVYTNYSPDGYQDMMG